MDNLLKLKRETDYAVRCILHIARKKNRKISNVATISEEEDIPTAFVAKILQRLTKGGIVEPIRGKKGGYKLKLAPSRITLFKVIEIMEGVPEINICLSNNFECHRKPTCPFHRVCKEIQENLIKCFKSYTFTKILKNTGE
ncbi:MAG: Rrf2 family transcriptional regulator [Candidatus Schekmanbacteria bacterium]|nr:MAG: Rrf2 family transcriptional regulator [Candidatus Schekmanbacteria bacterium]